MEHLIIGCDVFSSGRTNTMFFNARCGTTEVRDKLYAANSLPMPQTKVEKAWLAVRFFIKREINTNYINLRVSIPVIVTTISCFKIIYHFQLIVENDN